MKVINETFLSNALLQCLRTWKERVGEAPLCLSWDDIDQLYDWVDNLQDQAKRVQTCREELMSLERPPERSTTDED